MMKRFAALSLLLAVIFILSGCGLTNMPQQMPFESPVPSTEPAEPEPVKGGTLNVPVPVPDTFNPLMTESRDMLNFLGLIFESTVAYDRKLHPVPMLASGWEVSPDERIWVFNIRKGIKWHDGKAFTAKDVLFTFQALQSGLLGSYYSSKIYQNPNIIEAGLKNGDPYTFYIRLAEPSYDVLDMMTFPVLPENVFQSAEIMASAKDDLSMLPVGTGPYKVDKGSIYDGRTLKLVRNESWWGGEPYIDSIMARTYSSNEQARNAFNAGEVDLVDTMVVYANTFADTENSVQHKYLTQSYEFLALNNESPLFADNNVRKAIAYAINRKDIISKVYLNNAETVDVPVSSDSWLYENSYRIYDYDAGKAGKLLKSSGWSDSDGDGILDRTEDGKKTNLTFTILTNSDNDFRRDAVNLIASHLRMVGFDVVVRTADWEQLTTEIMPNREFDAILTGYYLKYSHDLSFAFHSSRIGAENGNFTGYADPELDNLLDKAQTAYDDAERLDIYRKIQKHFTDELPVISLYFLTGSLLTDKRIHGIDRVGELSIFRDIKDWYIVEKN